jgi:hypothetical protein
MPRPADRLVLTGLALAGLAAGAPAAPAAAQDLGDFPFDRFALSAGSFYETTDADLRLDAGTAGGGTLFSLEEDLGLDASTNLLRLELEWRFADRHQLTAAYFELSRDGGRTIDREIAFGDTVFPVSASLATESEFEFTELHYTYWAVKKPRGGVGIDLGAAIVSFGASLEAELDRPGGGGSVRLVRSASTDLPVPLLGVEGRWTPARRLLVGGAVRVLPSIEIEDFEGSALSYMVRLEYRAFRHFGVGASWSDFAIDVDVEKPRFRGAIDFTIEGAQLYLRFAT